MASETSLRPGSQLLTRSKGGTRRHTLSFGTERQNREPVRLPAPGHVCSVSALFCSRAWLGKNWLSPSLNRVTCFHSAVTSAQWAPVSHGEQRREGPKDTGMGFLPSRQGDQVRKVGRLGQPSVWTGVSFCFCSFFFFLPFLFSWSSSLGDREILLSPNFWRRDPIIYVFII